MPPCQGDSARSSFHTSSAVGWPQSAPRRRARSARIARSARACPGGSSALRTRCTRRSLEVTVPSSSHHEARRGQHDVGDLGGLRQEHVLHDDVLEALEQLDRALLVGLRLHRVLAEDVERLERAVLHRLEHLREVPALRRRDRGAPGALELRARLRVLDVLAAGQLVGQRAHVAAALHVVLAAQRDDARAPAPDVAGQQRQVDQREDVVDRVVVLGDAERPADLRLAGLRVRVRDVADRRRRHARLALGVLERVLLDALAVRVEAGRRPLDERAVLEPGVEDLARHRVGERDVRADVEPEPHVRPLGRDGAPRIDDHQPRAVVHALQDVVEEDRVRLARVRSPQEDEVRLLDLTVRARAATRSEHRRQTDDAGGVSGAVAAVDVVRAEDDPGELLREVVHLVRRLRAGEEADRLPAVLGAHLAESLARPGRAPRPSVAARSFPFSRTIGSVNLTYDFIGTPGGGAAPLPGPD